MAAKKDKKSSTKDDKASAKGRKGKKGKSTGGSGGGDRLSVASDPRAAMFVRRAKGWGGLAGFMIAGYLSLSAGAPFPVAGERALLAGLAGYLLGWGCSVTIWRQLMIAEIRDHAAKELQIREQRLAETTIKPHS